MHKVILLTGNLLFNVNVGMLKTVRDVEALKGAVLCWLWPKIKQYVYLLKIRLAETVHLCRGGTMTASEKQWQFLWTRDRDLFVRKIYKISFSEFFKMCFDQNYS